LSRAGLRQRHRAFVHEPLESAVDRLGVLQRNELGELLAVDGSVPEDGHPQYRVVAVLLGRRSGGGWNPSIARARAATRLLEESRFREIPEYAANGALVISRETLQDLGPQHGSPLLHVREDGLPQESSLVRAAPG